MRLLSIKLRTIFLMENVLILIHTHSVQSQTTTGCSSFADSCHSNSSWRCSPAAGHNRIRLASCHPGSNLENCSSHPGHLASYHGYHPAASLDLGRLLHGWSCCCFRFVDGCGCHAGLSCLNDKFLCITMYFVYIILEHVCLLWRDCCKQHFSLTPVLTKIY